MSAFQARPQHKTFTPHVDVPTLLVEREDGNPKVVVQWFGEADVDVSAFQFHFPVPIPVESLVWLGHPEKFKVILLGQVKDWPKPEARDKVARTVDGTFESWILWVTSSHYTTQHSDGEGPACFMMPFRVMLADPTCGVILPRKYCDLAVLEQENERVRSMTKK